MDTPPPDLDVLVKRCISPSPNWREAMRLIEFCRLLALAYLNASSMNVRLLADRLGLRLENVAYDSIAELFARGEEGEFKELQRWAQAVGINRLGTAEEIYHPLRRLVLGAVHERVYYLYHDADPALARLIRNIKLALPKHPSVKRLPVNGEVLVVPRHASHLRLDLPAACPELLLPFVLERSTPRSSLRDILSALGDTLRAQTMYRRGCTVVEAALLTRMAYASCQRVEAQAATEDLPDPSVVEGDIRAVVQEIRVKMMQHYITRNRLTAEEGGRLLDVVRSILLDEFSTDDGEERGYFEHMRCVHQTITRDQYRSRYRVIVEYLAKRARTSLRSRLKARM